MAKGDMAKPAGLPAFLCAVRNYRTWVMLLTYGERPPARHVCRSRLPAWLLTSQPAVHGPTN
jgi:hypothetical protein